MLEKTTTLVEGGGQWESCPDTHLDLERWDRWLFIMSVHWNLLKWEWWRLVQCLDYLFSWCQICKADHWLRLVARWHLTILPLARWLLTTTTTPIFLANHEQSQSDHLDGPPGHAGHRRPWSRGRGRVRVQGGEPVGGHHLHSPGGRLFNCTTNQDIFWQNCFHINTAC